MRGKLKSCTGFRTWPFGGALYPMHPVKNGLEIVDVWSRRFSEAGLLSFSDLWGSSLLKIFKKKVDRDICTIELCGETLFVKRYHKNKRWPFFWLRPEGSEVEWSGAQILKEAGLKTFDPVAIGSDGLGKSIIVITKVAGGRINDFLARNIPFDRKVRAVSKLAQFAADFHALGVSHQDFYLCHFFWDEPCGHVSVVDLQRLRRAEPMVISWLIKDIAQLAYSSKAVLNVSEWDKLSRIFWDIYTARFPECGSKRIVARIERKVLQIARHDHRLKLRTLRK